MAGIIGPDGIYDPLGMPSTALFADGMTRRAMLQADRIHIEVRFNELQAWVVFSWTQAREFVRLRVLKHYLNTEFVIDDQPDSPEWPTRCTLVGIPDPKRFDDGALFIEHFAMPGE